MEKETKIALTRNEWWSLVRADLTKWNQTNHEGDSIGIQDWIGEIGEVYGWKPFRDRFGDWDVFKIGDEDDEDEDY